MKKLICRLIGHNYTCKAQQGINPTPAQIHKGQQGFIEYAKIYCKRCNHVQQ